MKRLLAALLLAGLATAPAFAQQGTDDAPQTTTQGPHRADPQERLQRMTKMLQLTPDQQAKIGALLQGSAQQVQSIRADGSLQPADKRARMQALMQSTQEHISGLLTDTQRQRWNAMREKMQEHRDARQQGQSDSATSH